MFGGHGASRAIWRDPGEGGPTWGGEGTRENGEGGLSGREGWGQGRGGALRGPQVSRGVCEMTVADLGGISPFSLTYTPGLAQTETRGGRGDSGGWEGGS